MNGARLALAVAVALAACKAKPNTSEPPPTPAVVADVATPHEVPAARLAITDEAARLPGTLWFTTDGKLARLAGGVLTTGFDDAGADVFPSRWALPDGRLVGIASRGTGAPDSEQLVLIGPGTAIERIGPSAAQVRNPAVDPAGKWIVIESKVQPESELYRIDLATGRATQLTTNPQGNFTPAVLGPDAIAFASSRDGDSEIYRATPRGEHPKRLTAFHRDDWLPTPSPDGASIAFLSDREGRPRICLVDADGAHFRRLTTRRNAADAAADDEADPVWSPDGTSIAYLVEAAGQSHAWLRDLATGTERILTPDGATDGELSFSPDGAWLAVARSTAGVTDLWAIPTSGAAPALQITRGASLDRLPRWH